MFGRRCCFDGDGRFDVYVGSWCYCWGYGSDTDGQSDDLDDVHGYGYGCGHKLYGF